MIFRTVPVQILDNIGEGYGKVFIKGYVVIIGCTDGDGVISVVGLVIERLVGGKTSIGV